MNDSVLTTVKKLLGIPEKFTQYDPDVIVSINSAFSTLRQLGVGPEEGFRIEDDDAVWEDFIEDDAVLEMVELYVYQKTRLGFDPPSTSFAIDAIKESIKELEWRMCSEMDERTYEQDQVDGEEENQNGKFVYSSRRNGNALGNKTISTVSKRQESCRRKGSWRC